MPRQFSIANARYKVFAILVFLAALVVCRSSSQAAAALTVAITLDKPPYVVDKATSGIEVDLMRRALPHHKLRFVQMSHAQVKSAVPEKRADAALGVQQSGNDAGIFYSEEFVTFENVAISKKSARMKIARVADLASHRVLTWQNASLQLGPEFQGLFAPGAPHHGNYVEFADQRKQVHTFWTRNRDVLVIDRSIFDYFTVEMKHSTRDVAFHELFNPVTNFRVAFQDAATRDAFNQGLARLCRSGEYRRVLKKYGLEMRPTVCDRPHHGRQ